MAQQDTIDKIINIQFKYSELVQGWVAASDAIDDAKTKLQEFKKEGNATGIAKQTQIIKALRTEMAAYTREMQANIKEEVKQEGSIEQLRGSIAKLTAAYNKMSREERNAAKGTDLAKKIAGLQTELNEANTALLNFRDNVGNYASAAKGFSPLTFQVQQLAREMPSLTVSLQQFFLAVSNNVPMFVDELKRATAANKALRSEGKATIPVFRQVISSIVSWQTALVLIITLLTAYGKEIGSWVKSLFSAKEAITATEYAQRQLNAAQLEGRNAAQAEVVNLQILYNATQNTALAYKDRLNAVKELQKQYPAYFGNMSQEKILAGELSETYEMLVRNIMAKAQAEAAQNQIVTNLEKKNTIEQIQAYQNLTRVMADYNRLKAEGADDKMLESYAKAAYTLRKEVDSELKKMNEDLYNEVRDNSNSYQEYIDNLDAANSKLVKVATDNLLTFQNTQKGVDESSETSIEQSARWIDEFYSKMAKKRTKLLADWRVALSREVSKMEAELNKELQKMDSEISDNLRKQLEEQELEYRNRINEARLIDNDLGAAMEMVNIYKEQIAQIEKLESVYRAAGKTDAEIQAIRIKARMDLQKAEENVANIQIETTHKSLSLAAQTAGNLANVFEQLGGESEKYAAFAKAMAVMQVVLSESVAIAKAWEGNAALPFPANIIATAASVAAIVAAIASALSSTKSTEVPKYASGGLITGPGTGTSDSIVARVSNGEAIMTAQAVNDWGAVLSAMNVSSGGNAIQVSNLPQRGDGMRGMEQMMERVLLNLPSPIVLVKDIDNGQRRVKVAANLAKLGRKK